MATQKNIVFLPDGMADEPIDTLGGLTPLQAVDTPGMDRIAREGRCGTLRTLPDNFPTSSDVANMSVLGCDLQREYCGRAVLEAMAQELPLKPDDVALRCNLISRDANGRLLDFAGGHLPQPDAEALVAILNRHLANEQVRFYPGVSYRCLLVLSGGFHTALDCEKPDDHAGGLIAEHLPRARLPEADATVARLRDLMRRASRILEDAEPNRRAQAAGRPPANGIWLWSPGRAGRLQPFRERTGASGAVISAVDVIRGLGRGLDMEIIHVPGATGYIDTNYEGKAAAAVEAIRRVDFVYLHVEAIDEVSHAQDLKLKLRTIADFDRRIVQPVMRACGPEIGYVVLPDHPVPVRLGKHTRTPVPVAWRDPKAPPDSVQTFDEFAVQQGALGGLAGADLMRLLYPRRIQG